MRLSTDAVLRAAGIIAWDSPIDVLRDGFPSYVARVRTVSYPGKESVVVKAGPDSSVEPEVLRCLHRLGQPVPAVFDVRDGNGFRVIVMEDAGEDALHKHQDVRWYKAGVRQIARLHRQSRLSHSPGGPWALLAGLAPIYNDAKWAEIVRKGLKGTLRRFEDGTYTGLGKRERNGLTRHLRDLAENTLVTTLCPRVHLGFLRVFIHGDYHDGNILIRTPMVGGTSAPLPSGAFAVVDWDSARWDSGFFDLVSLFDVAERMGGSCLEPQEIIQTYTSEMPPDGLNLPGAEAEWRRCRILRAWDELRWFSETGEDFGDRVAREVEIIGTRLGQNESKW